ncbi:hypothetical protein [Nitratireductor aquibiodomus]|uniref:hypothetical protein n=1 Tax=Nitratireductor aquibiodomus TaxID=204799 RepID=UPI0012FD3E4F|nr:hypothetical protein [Nitratireductor aquibiodomus]
MPAAARAMIVHIHAIACSSCPAKELHHRRDVAGYTPVAAESALVVEKREPGYRNPAAVRRSTFQVVNELAERLARREKSLMGLDIADGMKRIAGQRDARPSDETLRIQPVILSNSSDIQVSRWASSASQTQPGADRSRAASSSPQKRCPTSESSPVPKTVRSLKRHKSSLLVTLTHQQQCGCQGLTICKA